MTDKKQCAMRLAELGFWVFRIIPNGKTPYRKGWQNEATRDLQDISRLWDENPECNIGLLTGRYQDDKALLAIDEDNKNGKTGAATVFQLDLAGFPFPRTAVQLTPTGGRHHVYSADVALRQGVGVFKEFGEDNGLDVRSRGGYLVGAGSTIDGREYSIGDAPCAPAPAWLVERLSQRAAAIVTKPVDLARVDLKVAEANARRYIEVEAPNAEEGGRNDTAFRICAQLRDRCPDEALCHALLIEWNENNDPPLEDEELRTVVDSVFKSAQNAAGAKTAAAMFDNPAVAEKPPEEKVHPLLELNKEFAFTVAGGGHHILWETTNSKRQYALQHLAEPTFHKMLADKTITIGKTVQALSKFWISHRECRRYKGLIFAPGQTINREYFNMWRGFAVTPVQDGEIVTAEARRGLEAWLEHTRENICNGDPALFRWVVGWLAQLVQNPGRKPLTALVLKGSKGVGKNAFIGCVTDLLGQHALTTSKKRYLTSNFNGHFEACLMLVLDEAFWSGDKEAEGTLKDLITGKTHNIEHKGKETYEVDNLTRVVILGNEAWVIPASDDERRFAVLLIGEKRKQDRAFFSRMVEDMQAGGNRLLLRFLLDYDMTGIDVDHAPATKGLAGQKIESLDPFGQWWFDILWTGELHGATGHNFSNADFKCLSLKVLRQAFDDYSDGRRISARRPNEHERGHRMRKYAPSLVRTKVGGEYCYVSGGLDKLRKDFEEHLRSKIDWPADDKQEDLECFT